MLLLSVGAAVYIATQKSTYDISVTGEVKTPVMPVFRYVNEYRNWPQWAFDRGAELKFGPFTSGKGSWVVFDSAGQQGKYLTVSAVENAMITQQIQSGSAITQSVWQFDKLANRTRITWKVKGEMSFMNKVNAAFSGGPNAVMEDKYSILLENLTKSIDRELNTYSIVVDGVVTKPGGFYLGQKITSTIDNAPRNIRIMLSNVNHFFAKNKIPMAGKPFILYESFDNARGITRFTVCGPMMGEVHTMPGSDMISGQFAGFTAVRTTLTGDHSHLKEAWDKTFSYITENGYQESDQGEYLEVFALSQAQSGKPSQWKTEIYIPIVPKAPTITTPTPTLTATPKPTPRPVEVPPADDSPEISIP